MTHPQYFTNSILFELAEILSNCVSDLRQLKKEIDCHFIDKLSQTDVVEMKYCLYYFILRIPAQMDGRYCIGRFSDLIKRPQKADLPELKEEEDRVIRNLLLKGTYPLIPNLSQYYELWHTESSFNARWTRISISFRPSISCRYLLTYRSHFTKVTVK